MKKYILFFFTIIIFSSCEKEKIEPKFCYEYKINLFSFRECKDTINSNPNFEVSTITTEKVCNLTETESENYRIKKEKSLNWIIKDSLCVYGQTCFVLKYKKEE